MGFIGISTAEVNSLMSSQDDNLSRLAGNRDVAQLAAPHLPFAAFSSSEQLRMPPGLRAAPGTWSSEMELLFMVMPRACSSATPQLCAALANRLGWVLRVSSSQFLAARVLVVSLSQFFAASTQGLRFRPCKQVHTEDLDGFEAACLAGLSALRLFPAATQVQADLLVIAAVQVSHLPNQPGVDEAISSYQVVAQCCLAVIDMGQDADVSDARLQSFQEGEWRCQAYQAAPVARDVG